MLKKKELLSIPVKTPEPVQGMSGSGNIHQLPSGQVFIFDIFAPASQGHKWLLRFCCDGKNYITYDAKYKKWTKENIQIGYYYNCTTSKETNQAARKFFETKYNNAYWNCRHFINNKNWQDRTKAYERKVDRMKQHLALFPNIPKAVNAFADRIFPNYIFLSNMNNKQRDAYCCACKKTFKINVGKHKENCTCPKCGTQSIYFMQRYANSIRDKTKLYMVHQNGEYQMQRWVLAMRTYSGRKASYDYSGYFYTVAEPDGEKQKIKAYGKKGGYGYMGLGEKKYLKPYENDVYIYPKGINEMYKIDNIDLEQIFGSKPVQMDLASLLRNLKQYPQTEYLLKSGLSALAANLQYLNTAGRNFQEITGVSKQYFKLYCAHNIDEQKNAVIRQISQEEFVDESLFLKLCTLKIDKYELARYENIKKRIGGSWHKIINYIYKQHLIRKISGYSILGYYGDYLNMMQELKIPITKKWDRFPKNVFAEHDRLVDRINQIKCEQQNKEFQTAIEALYRNIPTEFKNDQYCIVLPQNTADFTREGQTLKICVGGQYYIDKHKCGESLIFFIRRNEAKDTPFVCCELDGQSDKIRQIHGYRNDIENPLSRGVKKFAQDYVDAITEYRTLQTKTA